MSLTTNPNDPCLINGQKETGQNNCYLILSEEERSKGFIRPYRDSYVHKGRKYTDGIQILTEPKTFEDRVYVAIANIKLGDSMAGTYLTQEELDQYNKTGGYVGGCGVSTKMARAISETYARNPKFYGATFCCSCNKHLPVSEFLWEDGEVVGS